MRPLYAITADLHQLNDLLDEIEGDLSRLGEMEPAVTGWLELLGEEQAAKLDGYVGLIKTLEMEAAAAQAEKEQWQAKEKARTARADYLKAKLKQHLEATGQLKVQTASGRVVTVQKNGGVQPLEIKPGTDPLDLPPQFVRVVTEYSVDKAQVRAALERGEPLNFAELLPRGTSLRVK
jgi:hypothetical protein